MVLSIGIKETAITSRMYPTLLYHLDPLVTKLGGRCIAVASTTTKDIAYTKSNIT